MRSIPPISKFHTLLHNGAKKICEIILQRRCLLFQPGSNIRSVKILRDFGEIVLWYKVTKSMFISFHFSSVLVTKLQKYYELNLCLHFARQDGQDGQDRQDGNLK